MATRTISQLIAAGVLDGNEVVEISVLSDTVTIEGSTLSADASDESFNDSGDGFLTAGFANGDYIRSQGFATGANNIHSAKLASVAAGKIVLETSTDYSLINESGVGTERKISKWLSRRTTLQAIADLAGGSAEYPDFVGNAGKALIVNEAEDGVEWGSAPGGGGSALYRFGSFFTTEPAADEILMAHPATDPFTIPADLDGSFFAPMDSSTNPSATTTFSLQRNGVEFATIAVSTGGVVTLDGTSQDVEVGDLIELVAPTDSNGMTGWAFTFRSTGTVVSTPSVFYPALLPDLGNDSVGWTDITIRHRVDAAAFVPVATTKCRLAFRSSGAEGLTVSKVYVGVEDATQFNFSEPPTAVTFGGNLNFAIAAKRTIWSDEIDLPFAPGDDLLITLHVAAASSAADGFSAALVDVNGGYVYKAGGDDAATEVASGYTPSVTAKFLIAGILMGAA